MRSKLLKRLVNGTAYLFSVLLLLSMVAAPVIASVSANQVTSTHIRDNTILNRDIAPNKISSSRIKDYTIVKEDIHSGSINKYKLVTGAVTSAKIEDATIQNADISGSAGIEDSKISYSTKTKVLSMSSQAFMPRDDTYTYTKGANTLYMDAGSGVFSAPVYLPDGATVTSFKVVAQDNHANDITGQLYRKNGSADNIMVDVLTSGAAPGFRTFTSSVVENAVIDNNTWAYFVRVAFGDASFALALDRVVITYKIAEP